MRRNVAFGGAGEAAKKLRRGGISGEKQNGSEASSSEKTGSG
jgi:hypothetical protein